jgi:hypothetical protein
MRGLKSPPPSESSLCALAARSEPCLIKATATPIPYFFGALATATNESAQP